MREPLRVLDLFSGVGGFSLGLERAGMTTVAFCEIEEYPRRVLAKHWPHVPIHRDVRELNGADVGAVDVVCGGFPCQDISYAGLGAGLDGERSGLWREQARVIGEVRPSFVIVENPAAIRGRGLDEILGHLAAIGFDAVWDDIPASFVGAPHARIRTWIVAYAERGERWAQSYRGALGRMGREQQSVPWDRDWQSALRELRGMDDGSAYRVDRVDTIRNSVVPQIPEIIGRAILAAEANA